MSLMRRLLLGSRKNSVKTELDDNQGQTLSTVPSSDTPSPASSKAIANPIELPSRHWKSQQPTQGQIDAGIFYLADGSWPALERNEFNEIMPIVPNAIRPQSGSLQLSSFGRRNWILGIVEMEYQDSMRAKAESKEKAKRENRPESKSDSPPRVFYLEEEIVVRPAKKPIEDTMRELRRKYQEALLAEEDTVEDDDNDFEDSTPQILIGRGQEDHEAVEHMSVEHRRRLSSDSDISGNEKKAAGVREKNYVDVLSRLQGSRHGLPDELGVQPAARSERHQRSQRKGETVGEKPLANMKTRRVRSSSIRKPAKFQKQSNSVGRNLHQRQRSTGGEYEHQRREGNFSMRRLRSTPQLADVLEESEDERDLAAVEE